MTKPKTTPPPATETITPIHAVDPGSSRRGRKSFALRITLVAVTAAIFVTAPQQVAFAYSGSGAASYADTWWNFRNTQNYPTFNDDCTNFVSQALHDYHGGRYSFVNPGQNASSDYNWWVELYFGQGGVWENSRSWSFAQDLYDFLSWTYPGGIPEGTAATLAQQQATYTPNSVVTGDLIFYDWNSDNAIDHVSIQTGWGTDRHSNWYGNYVDQHTTDREHAFWSLLPYNSQWYTTTIYFMHIDPRNG